VELNELQNHIRKLATLEENDSPLISCYLDVRNRVPGFRDELASRIHLLNKTLGEESLKEFQRAAAKITHYLEHPVPQHTQGIAVFSRAGKQPFWLALHFAVPLPNRIAVGTTPNIYHLVELKDNYDRYVILLATETSARIIGVNLGSVTAQLWQSRPDLRRRIGHEWTKEHFQDHRRERGKQFLHEQIRSLEQVISSGGYGHLILAGNAQSIAAIRRELPKPLARKLVDSVPASAADNLSDVVASTLQAFMEHEELESQAIAEKLIAQIHTHGLAVAGTRASIDALRNSQADVLVLLQSYDPGAGWECRGCGKMELQLPRPNGCPQCRAGHLRDFDIRGELVRLAEQQQVAVEVVEHNDILMSLGGVGCLLRYLAPESYMFSAA
jgi:rubrerythrin